jgi:CubicO group peptidase (beta-lactamase class C family)/D-alanyl-D-alanine dipeptidase
LALVISIIAPAAGPVRADATVGPVKPYEAAAKQLEAFIAREVAQKNLPALSIVLVDDQRIVWARGFGLADPVAKKPADADTAYCVGSVSKLFTDLAVMQLVERGSLDLDAPVTKYLPDFKPVNPFNDKPITLRQLMTHRSGLVREPPVGHYFDPTEPSLARTVQSLNQTELVYAPETRTKYSNAGLATVGFVLETTQKQPFPRYIQKALLDPLGMKHSSFAPGPDMEAYRAKGTMWTYFGREFPAPMFQLGLAPAGSLHASVNDLGRFLTMLFAGGKAADGKAVVKAETLEQMWKPQFVGPNARRGFGLGFMVSELEGHRRVGHSGAVYGFATELAALPDDKLGVAVVATRDCANGVTGRIAEEALRHLLAVKQDKPLPRIIESTPLKPELARQLAGRYQAGSKILDLHERDGRLWLLPGGGGDRVELRAVADGLLVDDPLEFGRRITLEGDKLRLDGETYERTVVTKPEPPPAKWLGLIGEYGWDHDTLYILEKDGRLHALIEWFFLYPLEEISENVFKFPSFGLYHDEKLIFTRDRTGRATQVEAAQVVFARRKLDGENGETFKIKPARPLEQLRREALAAKPPEEKGDFLPTQLVDLTTLDDTIKLDIRYATDNNFLSTPFYTSAKAFLQKPAAEALARVHKKLAGQGYGLLIFDGYRPWSVTKMFWEATPEKLRVFVADPEKGSRHNRGCAVDLTLYDLKTGKPIEMVGGYDEMSDRSYPDYLGGTSRQRWHRDLLRRAMEAEGFTVYEAEWWHFDYKDWKKYRIGNQRFEEIATGKADK